MSDGEMLVSSVGATFSVSWGSFGGVVSLPLSFALGLGRAYKSSSVSSVFSDLESSESLDASSSRANSGADP